MSGGATPDRSWRSSHRARWLGWTAAFGLVVGTCGLTNPHSAIFSTCVATATTATTGWYNRVFSAPDDVKE
jgi:hypothetical protein